MSTLSANRLPTQAQLTRVLATFVGVTPINAPPDNVCVVTFDLYAQQLVGKVVDATLLPTTMPEFFWMTAPYNGPTQRITLVEGNLTCTFTLSAAQYQLLQGHSLYILVTCLANDRRYSSSTNAFSLVPVTPQACDCGAHLGAIFALKDGGPNYNGPGPYAKGLPNLTADTSRLWATLLSSGQVTREEKDIICVAAGNEGRFDTVHTSDNQVLTMGIMQKTIRPGDNEGELAQQLYEFQQAEPVLFDCYLGRCGWSLRYQGTSPFRCEVTYTEGGVPYRGSDLRTHIRSVTDPAPGTPTKEGHCNRILQAFVLLGRLPEFQDKEIRDAIRRLHQALNVVVESTIKVSDYFKSTIGKGLAYDQSVNRKNAVDGSVHEAVTALVAYYAKKGVKVKRDPTTWGSDHATYERKLIELYGPNRNMTDPRNRNTHMLRGLGALGYS